MVALHPSLEPLLIKPEDLPKDQKFYVPGFLAACEKHLFDDNGLHAPNQEVFETGILPKAFKDMAVYHIGVGNKASDTGFILLAANKDALIKDHSAWDVRDPRADKVLVIDAQKLKGHLLFAVAPLLTQLNLGPLDKTHERYGYLVPNHVPRDAIEIQPATDFF